MAQIRLLAAAVVGVPAVAAALRLEFLTGRRKAPLSAGERIPSVFQTGDTKTVLWFPTQEGQLEAARSNSVADRSSSAAGGACLFDLPPAALELICQALPRQDRWALASCCKPLLAQFFSSPLLWGDLHVRLGSSKARGQAFYAWLSKRLAGLQRLHIEWAEPTAVPNGLAVLSNWGLTQLQLSRATLLERFQQPYGLPALQPQVALPRLPAVQKLVLRECDRVSEAVFRSLSLKLPALVALELVGFHSIGLSNYRQEAALPGLVYLTRLSYLSLVDWNLWRVPQELSELRALRELDLSNNSGLRRGFQEEPAAHLRTLHQLTELTALRLVNCSLREVPVQLSSLSALGALDLSKNSFSGAAAGLTNLEGLLRLTRLNLSKCHLSTQPSFLSSLSLLADLDLSGNCFYYVHHLDALRHLTTLTRLNLSACGMRCPPASIMTPTSLQVLDVSNNNMRGTPLLHQLPHLTSLDLSSCNLHSWPAYISQMPSLKVLLLHDNTICDPPPQGIPPSLHVEGLSHVFGM